MTRDAAAARALRRGATAASASRRGRRSRRAGRRRRGRRRGRRGRWRGCRGRRSGVSRRHVPRRRARRPPCRGRRAIRRASPTRRRADRAEGHGAAGEARGARDHPRVAGVGDQHRRGVGAFEDLGLGVGDRLDRREVLRGAPRRRWSRRARRARRSPTSVRISPARFIPSSTTAMSGAASRRARAATAAGRCGCSGCRDCGTSGARREERGRDFLGRRLARDAGDRQTRRGAALPPHGARRSLQRQGRVRRPRRHAGSGLRPGDGAAASAATTTPRAPRSSASPTKSCPSWRSPRMRDEQLAGDDARASRCEHAERRRPRAADDAAAGRARRPAGGQGQRPAHSSPRTAVDRLRAAPVERGARHRDVVERQRLVADDLVLLVALAGDQHGVAGLASRTARSMASPRSTIDRCGVTRIGGSTWPWCSPAGRRAARCRARSRRGSTADPRRAGCPTSGRRGRSAAPRPRPSAAASSDRDRRRSRTP